MIKVKMFISTTSNHTNSNTVVCIAGTDAHSLSRTKQHRTIINSIKKALINKRFLWTMDQDDDTISPIE